MSRPVHAAPARLRSEALPSVGRPRSRWRSFLRWKHARTCFQLPLFVLAILLIVHGLAGPQLAPKNLATLAVWVHYRGALVLALLVAGNLFCLGCPLVLARDVVRRFVRPRLEWPRALRNKWLAVALLALVLYAYEAFDWWGDPRATALLIVAYFAAAIVVDALFHRAAFCKYVCPIGQFNFVASTLSPLEVRVEDAGRCSTCETKDCIRGRRDERGALEARGCELALFQPRKQGNVDCTFCLDCVVACPHDNVVIAARLPGAELWEDPLRSGLGRFSKRRDLAALALLFTFGALLNAFGMVSPVYALQRWIADRLGLASEASVLAVLFATLLLVEPLLLLAGATWWTRRATRREESLVAIGTRYAYALVPLGFGVWLAHYAFHFLTGFLTIVPVAQSAIRDLGLSWLGEPLWHLGGLPAHVVFPMELGLLFLGLVGSLVAAWRISERDAGAAARRAFVPWAALAILLFSAAVWLLSQPMEMRGTFLG